MHTEISVIGAGGHALVVIDAIECSMSDVRISLYDEETRADGQLLAGYKIHAPPEWSKVSDYVHVAIGEGSVRERLSLKAVENGRTLLTVVHAAASLSSGATIGDGTFIAAGAVVAPGTRLGRGVIVNHNAVIDHDCVVGDFTHIAPGAVIAGCCHIGSNTLVGVGACVRPQVIVGDAVVVGAGAAVVNDVVDKAIVTGTPARTVRS